MCIHRQESTHTNYQINMQLFEVESKDTDM